ncbi:MAG: PAS domain S-box protein, partial [Anaerolineae bacterium]|nr:PAS domain S-box protein [Anaerolineae bacterium]
MWPRIRWGSLRFKIIAWSFVPTAIILMAVALVAFYAYQRVTEDLVIERDQQVTRLSAGQLADALAEFTDMLTALARTANIATGDPATQAAALRQARNRLAVFDGGAVILNTQGTVIAAEPPREDIQGLDWSDRAYYRRIVRSMEPTFSDIMADGPAGARVVTVAVPITGPQGEFLGILAGMFRVGATSVSSLYGTILKLRIGENGNIYLVDSGGRVIYHHDTAYIGADFSGQQAVRRSLQGEAGAIRSRDSTGRDIVAGFAPVPGTPWGLVSEESWGALLSAGQVYTQSLLLLLGLGVMIPAFVVAVGVRRITKPINDLIFAAQQVAGGNFGQVITTPERDEIGDLAAQFNRMSAQLQESYAALKEREERLTIVIQGTNDGIWDWDLRTNEVYFSPRWKSMLGYEDHELANRLEAWRSLTHPEDAERAQAEVHSYLEGQAPIYQLEHRLRHKDGSYRWILARGIALRDAQGRPYRMAGSHSDITERKEAEEALQASEAELRALFAAMTDVILVLDAHGYYVKVAPTNPSLLYKPATELTGRTLHELFPRPQADTFLAHIQHALETGRPVNFEYSLPIGDEEIWFAATVSPMLSDTVIWVARDITERKESERALRNRLAFERVITEISTEFINLGPEQVDAGIQHALEAIGQHVGADRSYAFVFSDNGTRMTNTHEWCAPGITSQRGRIQGQPSQITPWCTERIKRLEVVLVPRVAALPPEASRDRAEWEIQDIQSLVCVPMVYQGTAVGFVGFDAVRAEKIW